MSVASAALILNFLCLVAQASPCISMILETALLKANCSSSPVIFLAKNFLSSDIRWVAALGDTPPARVESTRDFASVSASASN